MRHLAAALVYIGVVGIVLGLSIVHGEYVGDDVVFGSALLLMPWWPACCTLSQAGRTRKQAWGRAVVVGDSACAARLRAELGDQPERPASVVGSPLDPCSTPNGSARSRSRIWRGRHCSSTSVRCTSPDLVIAGRTIRTIIGGHGR